MNSSCLDYRMMDEQRVQFDEQGYLIVDNAIGEDLLSRLLDAADRVDERERAARGLEPDAIMAKFWTIVEDDVFVEQAPVLG